MKTIKALAIWNFGSVAVLAGLSAILDMPFERVVSVAFVGGVGAMLAYGGVVVLRWTANIGQPRPRRYREPEQPREVAQPTIRVTGEVMPDPPRYNPWAMYTPQELARMMTMGRRKLPAPKGANDARPKTSDDLRY